MRETRFRVWDNYNKCIDYDFSVGEFNTLNIELENMQEAFILMQYSGIKDKQGKEIYEGDVVQIAGYGPMLIEFPFTDLYTQDDPTDIGVILGNIYENPELLKETL